MVYDMFIFYIPRIMPPKQRTTTAREAKLVRGSLDKILPIFGNSTTIWLEKAKQLNPGTRIWNWSGQNLTCNWKFGLGFVGLSLGLGVPVRQLAGWACRCAATFSLTKRARRLANLVYCMTYIYVYLIYRFIFISIWCESLLIAATGNIQNGHNNLELPHPKLAASVSYKVVRYIFFECQHVTLELNPKEKRTGKPWQLRAREAVKTLEQQRLLRLAHQAQQVLWDGRWCF